MNLHPDLRLCNNSADDYARSLSTIESILEKMATLVNATTASQTTATYSNDAIISLHRAPSNYYSEDEMQRDFVISLRRLSKAAASHDITLHLRMGAPGGKSDYGNPLLGPTSTARTPADIPAARSFLRKVNAQPASALKLAVSTAALVTAGTSALEVKELGEAGLLGMVLAAAPAVEAVAGTVWTNYGPLAGCEATACGPATAAVLAQARDYSVLVVADASLPTSLSAHEDASYLEAAALAAIAALPFPPPPPPPPPPPRPCALPAPPPAPAGSPSCYKLGTEQCGMCSIFGRGPYEGHATKAIRVSCVHGTCVADYRGPSGFVGAYGPDHFRSIGLTPGNFMYATTTIDASGPSEAELLWNVTITLHGKSASWSLAPRGDLKVGDVARVMCGGTDAAPTIVKESDFLCAER